MASSFVLGKKNKTESRSICHMSAIFFPHIEGVREFDDAQVSFLQYFGLHMYVTWACRFTSMYLITLQQMPDT